MKTEKTRVEGICYIWAYPKTEWEITQDIKDAGEGNQASVLPFKYAIRTGSTDYRDSAVRVCEFSVVGTVPDGIDLVQKAIVTLKTKIDDARKELAVREADLQKQINALALITYQPEKENESV